jgi:hypothetical protein
VNQCVGWTIIGRPKRAFSRAAVCWALRMARFAWATKGDWARRDLAAGFDLVLDVVIKFGFNEQGRSASPPGDQLGRAARRVKEQGFIRQGKIQQK